MNTDQVHQQVVTARSLLFVPANRPDRFDRATASGADAVVLDLEDAVPDDEKTAGREHVRDWLDRGGNALVRINAVTTSHFAADLDILAGTAVVVMLAKANVSSTAEVTARGFATVPLIETAEALLEARQLAHIDEVLRLSLGHLDLAAELGIDPDHREALLWARSTLVAASAAAGLAAPVEGVTVDVRDVDRVTADARYAKALGFTGKLCIHPDQVAPTHTGLMPTTQEIAWSDQVLSARTQHVALVGHRMVDRPVVLRALAIRAAAGGTTPQPRSRCES